MLYVEVPFAYPFVLLEIRPAFRFHIAVLARSMSMALIVGERAIQTMNVKEVRETDL